MRMLPALPVALSAMRDWRPVASNSLMLASGALSSGTPVKAVFKPPPVAP